MPNETERVEPQADPVTTETQPIETQQSPVIQDGHDDAQQDAAPTSSQTVQDGEQDDTPIDKEEYVRLKREAGKLRQTQEQFEQVKKSKESYEKWLLADPNRVKQALVELDGFTEEQASARIEDIRRQRPDLWQPQAGGQPAPQLDINTVVTKVREQDAFDRDLQEFMRQVPEMAPDKDPEKNRDKIELANDVNNAALILMRRNPNLSRVEAWKKAHKVITTQVEDEIEAAHEAGRMEGRFLATTDRVSNLGEPAGDKLGRTTGVKLTETERQAADMLGMTDEEYARFKA